MDVSIVLCKFLNDLGIRHANLLNGVAAYQKFMLGLFYFLLYLIVVCDILIL